MASAVGGIPEVVDDGVTGHLVPLDPRDPRRFERDLATAINGLVADPAQAAAMGRAGRARAVADFDWTTIAEKTANLYGSLRCLRGFENDHSTSDDRDREGAERHHGRWAARFARSQVEKGRVQRAFHRTAFQKPI